MEMLLSFKSSSADKQFNQKISQINIIANQLKNSSNSKQAQAVKQIFNIAFGKDKPNGLFQDVYKSTMTQKQISWVPKLQKLYSLFSPLKKDSLIQNLLRMRDTRISLQKNLIPQYLVRNKLLKERQSYSFINYSYQGYTVTLLDYFFMRLAWCISQTQFIQGDRDAQSLYTNDDFYFYISRNPYLMIFLHFVSFFDSQREDYKSMMTVIKLMLFQEALLKYKSGLSTTSLLNKYKVKLNYFYVAFLMLRKGRDSFVECELFLNTVLNDFANLLYTQNQSYLRTIIRIILFVFNPQSIQCQVIDALLKANKQEGCFNLKHYKVDEFVKTCNSLDKKRKSQFLNFKNQIIGLFQKQINYLSKGRVFNYSFIHNLACFFKYEQISIGKLNFDNNQKNREKLRGQILKEVLESFHFGVQFISTSSKQKFNQETVIDMNDMLQLMNEHLMKFYDSNGVDFSKIKSSCYKNHFKNQLNSLSPVTSDFRNSLKSYQSVKDRNCWQMPRKQGQLFILYTLFYALARLIDKIIPGHKDRSYPVLNLRYFSNPVIFLGLVLVIGFIIRILF